MPRLFLSRNVEGGNGRAGEGATACVAVARVGHLLEVARGRLGGAEAAALGVGVAEAEEGEPRHDDRAAGGLLLPAARIEALTAALRADGAGDGDGGGGGESFLRVHWVGVPEAWRARRVSRRRRRRPRHR
jgi:hypothetical protein|eukprot:COSAG01_NODE_2774_length_7098_cov_13.905571_2_plen_131_part_00